MAADVNQQLEHIAMEHGQMNEIQSKKWTKKLKLDGRYQEDIWG
jgi:sulfite reductase alpha subunit-like flavoprotein